MCPPPDTVYGRFRALPGRQRVLLGVVGMMLSGCGLYFSEKGQQVAPHELAAKAKASLVDGQPTPRA